MDYAAYTGQYGSAKHPQYIQVRKHAETYHCHPLRYSLGLTLRLPKDSLLTEALETTNVLTPEEMESLDDLQ